MKIGILTLRPQSNYGGVLQAAALVHYMGKCTDEVVLIEKELCHPLWKRAAGFVLRHLPFQNIRGYRHEWLKVEANRAFIDEHIPRRTEVCRTEGDLRRMYAREKFDAVIVGSDQVWRWDYIKDAYYSCYFLDYIPAKETRKIAYAASFGKDRWQEPVHISRISELLSEFNAVSTREDTGVSECVETFGRADCQMVLDPTLLVDEDFFYSLVARTRPPEAKGFMLTYVLDETPQMKQLANQFFSRHGKGLRRVDISHHSEKSSPVDIYQWLRLFHDADVIITDSFHGMIFSIIFRKQFVVVGNSRRGLSRFQSLLKMLSLDSRLQDADGAISDEIVQEKIDYSEVHSRLSNLRERSRNYLTQALG